MTEYTSTGVHETCSNTDLETELHKDLLAILESVLPDCPTNFETLLQSQLRNVKSGLEPRQRRWPPEVISICPSLWSRSKQGYADCRSTTALLQESVHQRTGFVKDNLVWMRSTALEREILTVAWHGGLLLDEMQIPDDLQVSASTYKCEIYPCIKL